jgi:hypothetical protein
MKIVYVVIACIAVGLFGAMALAKLPHALYGKRIAGEVVDAENGAPVPGAHVAFLWESTIIPSGFTGHNARDICYHAAAAVTDRDGKFDVPGWRKWSTYRVYFMDPIAIVYVRGYQPLYKPLQLGPSRGPLEHPNERYALKRFSGGVDQRMDTLFFNLANKACHYGGESQKSLYPMLKALYAEAREIARTSEQRETVESIRRFAAQAATAKRPGIPNEAARIEAFMKEELQ